VAWFKKKPTDLERLAGLVDEVRETAIGRFAKHGLAARVQEGTSGLDTVLVVGDSRIYPLYYLTTHLMSGDLSDVEQYVSAHVDGLVDADNAPDVRALSDADWLELVRVRLVPEYVAHGVQARYAQQTVGELVVVICVDYPTHLSYVSDAALGGRDPLALAALGLASVMDEPVPPAVEIDPGIWLIDDESPYTATKALGMASLVGGVLPAAPQGVLFGLPHRHALLAAPVGPEVVQTVKTMMSLIIGSAVDSAPGGPLSTSLYYWHEGDFERVGFVADDGGVHIVAAGRFGEVLSSLGD